MYKRQDQQDLGKNNLPIAVVESVDPLILGMKLSDSCQCQCDCCDCCDGSDIPDAISACFPCELNFSDQGKRVYVTLGQFSIIRLERDSQLLIPAYDYCIPSKECPGSNEEDPCAIFRKVQFPMEEFFPPNTLSQPEGYQETKSCCSKA